MQSAIIIPGPRLQFEEEEGDRDVDADREHGKGLPVCERVTGQLDWLKSAFLNWKKKNCLLLSYIKSNMLNMYAKKKPTGNEYEEKRRR